MREVELRRGPVRYRDVGDGPVVVLLHGLLVSGTLWRKVVPMLSGRFRCIVPDLPLGAHTAPMRADADLSPAGIAAHLAEFLDALDLREVTLVANDTGGAIAQLLVARHPERVARLVLTPCDAFEVFPPPLFAYLRHIARVPGVLAAVGRSMLAVPALTRLPIAFGWIAKRPIDPSVVEAWIRPGARDRRIRRDLKKLLGQVSPEVTLQVARELHRFPRPVLIAWTPEDRLFPMALAHRLAGVFPDARVIEIADSHAFVPEDNPRALAGAIESFVADVSVASGDRAPSPAPRAGSRGETASAGTHAGPPLGAGRYPNSH
jgi:pimeloyl-ACP methyl ester carboxylesterase